MKGELVAIEYRNDEQIDDVSDILRTKLASVESGRDHLVYALQAETSKRMICDEHPEEKVVETMDLVMVEQTKLRDMKMAEL